MKNNEDIYFTEEQLDRFLKMQTSKDNERFLKQYPDKTHINILEVVDRCEYTIPEEFAKIAWESILHKKNKHGFSIQSDCFLERDLDKFNTLNKKIDNMTDEELNTYVSDMPIVSEGYDVLKKRRGMF